MLQQPFIARLKGKKTQLLSPILVGSPIHGSVLGGKMHDQVGWGSSNVGCVGLDVFPTL